MVIDSHYLEENDTYVSVSPVISWQWTRCQGYELFQVSDDMISFGWTFL